jgi:predicted helicase
VLAFISNNGYLDNPTFRGMRQSLMETFDEIYVLDLHGNSKKKERSPDGSQDENVFDIQQGVSIGIFVKNANGKRERATICHAHLWGERGAKYKTLLANDLSTTQWNILAPQSPFYLFVPQDTDLKAEYETLWKLTEAFPVSNTGIITARDKFVRGFTMDEVQKRIADFRSLEFEEAKSKYDLGDVRERTLVESWRMVRELDDLKRFIFPMLRQPFDLRPLFYHHSLVRWPVNAIMRHMLAGENVGLITTRVTKDIWDCFACNTLMGHKALAAYDVNYLFPLYLYPDDERTSLFNADEPTDAPGGRRPNLAAEFVSDIEARLGMEFVADGKGDLEKTFGPEDVLAYIYAIFHSPTYRSRYGSFLKLDFPRLPLTSNKKLFRELCSLGDELTTLHLMQITPSIITRYPVAGDNTVEKVTYSPPSSIEDKGLFFEADGEKRGTYLDQQRAVF